MTITVTGKVSAPPGLELEVISTDKGVETNRTRYKDGADISLTVYEPHTMVLHEVNADAPAEQTPGEQRHGSLKIEPPAPTAQPGVAEQIAECQKVLAMTRDEVFKTLAPLGAVHGESITDAVVDEFIAEASRMLESLKAGAPVTA